MPTVATAYYFQRFGFCGRQIAARPHAGLGMVVVIPCFNEPDLIGSLESLWLCERPVCSVEVIVVVNSPANGPSEARLQNQATLKGAAEWIERHPDPRFAIHLLSFADLPLRQAGVGLARKIGMDEGLRRLDEVGRLAGAIVGYDADCRCQQNFLVAIERHFQRYVATPGCSVYFEHPLSGPLAAAAYAAVAAYELHLRYYIQALRFCGFPHAHHTLGSCMAVRADAYRKQGGMNKRKAGEDFYFLHKIIALGGFTDLTDTTVIPSARPSDRVPFGTGSAVRAHLAGAVMGTYPLQAFLDLKQLFDSLPLLYRHDAGLMVERVHGLPEPIRTFLDRQNFVEVLSEVRRNTSSEATFRKRFFHWFDGFLAMKFVHHARDRFYGGGDVLDPAAKLLAILGCAPPAGSEPDTLELLQIYRRLDRAPERRLG